MKKTVILAAFALLGTTLISCEVTPQKDNELADGSFGTDDTPVPFKPSKPTPPPSPPLLEKEV
jgi:hypothetical protein